ncbi:MAG: hypothetical protein A2945_05080 [Candidatus Liptonbacteria bacterium RIFCSPLOWO2_01_FULL_52_25]|uniref:Haloacid dehalogenase n=1 Tax=Candidatus Liptonbacteria bacterium RIFCSPLOWO2_01_FULL_52_25 TaxID=1798650 RepID=A0A1G2CF84_9BACT|nr:MAG: hypothetical protein A2945_05080 [Candidatus Liptonbacteria bacterium RIFCSPLOWO2_01_FULL_52_25]
MIKKKVAIFDIDGTIFRSSLLIKLVDALIREGIFKPGVADIYKKAHEDWLNRDGGYEAYIKGVVMAFDRNIQGVSYSDLRRIAHRVVVENKSRTYRYTRDLVRDLKGKGYYVMAISHSPKLALEGFCKTLGFNKVYGLMYDVDKKGKFTGRFLFPDLIFSKDKILERALGEGGLTLAGSVGVGDTESDIPFLKMVKRPICFNPNKKLYEHAKKSGWEIVVERKDVIYKI